MYEPKFLKLWTHPENYAGAVWPNTYYSGFGRSRDSDCLEESNFHTAWKAISAVAEDSQIVREHHWAVGWVEWIAINADDTEALKVADALRARYERYPALDEDDLSEREQEAANQTWRDCYTVKARIEYIRNASKYEFEFRSFADLLGCVRGKYFAGYASELLG
jgi:hypothetical protein